MILSEEIVTILFRLINFGVLLYGLHYVYIHYICPAMQTDIEADEKKVAILAQQKDAYYQQEQFIVKDIENQEKTVTHLIAKLDQWRIAADDAQKAQRDAHAALQEALRKKIALQSEHIAQYMLERRALPHAMHELEVSLAEHFKSDKRGAVYLEAVVNHMDKDR